MNIMVISDTLNLTKTLVIMKRVIFFSQLALVACRVVILIFYKIEYICLQNMNHVDPPIIDDVSTEDENRYDEPYKIISHYIKDEMHFKDKDVSIKNVSHQCHVNKSIVIKAIQVKTHSSFACYIRRLRIDYACVLLVDPQNFKIDFISDASGFNNSRTFVRNFKMQLNMPPSEYRHAHKLKHDLFLMTKR